MNKHKLIFYLSAVMFFISSSVVFFVPFNNLNKTSDSKIIEYSLGCIFWLFLIGGIVFQFILSKIRKKNCKDQLSKGVFFNFFSNTTAIFFDLIFILSIIGNIIFLVLKINIGWLQILTVFGLLFGLEMHFVLNGENFKYIN
jgi:hypothetical protein